ncbi:hypothetical protein B0I35DRAFT_190787 [Stachybotrys elegans]|uniref:Uncharacterized protein n=1 Tax=Stachybotrys elegans TaxID=80388 RepID=A0A8K0WUA1_9HYPO|nr:hypothetical protein B0I35DRAFT_190787 [Stachybotrys elegans]
MMAAEPAVNSLADVPASPELQIQVNDSTHDGRIGLPLVNGTSTSDDIENKHISHVEDQLNSADVSVSGGSDTEASRADGSRQKDGDRGHGRTGSSAKKPATFKAVSVNKTFLAAKVNTSSASAKVNDKPSPSSSTPPPGSSTLSASRPRLVAKTGSGTKDSLPRFSTANGRKPASAPDPNVVWNKNRPPPVPEPRKFTDEELKKYGIHMASRLNEDDAQGQNKWADIDDDDDDWAPEAITWGDGTKTTLPHPEEHPAAPASDSGSAASRVVAPTPLAPPVQDKPSSPAPAVAVSSPLPKPSTLSSGKGLVLKSGGHDKPTLVSKPPTQPAPAKSPWATLPPVDKQSPVAVDLGPVSRNSNRDHHKAHKGMIPPPKEIAADDFNRSSYRDGGFHHANRELYNSHSGRYEPVPDRHGPMRADGMGKNPSLLQRHMPQDHPAEPSSAFQTNRTAQDAPFGRRRGSSNVSGGSGNYFQRMNKGADGSMPPPEILSTRRPSFAGSSDSPASPNLPISMHGQPRQQQGGAPWPVRSSPRTPGAALHSPVGPPNTASAQLPGNTQPPAVDEVEYQKKLMRERNELARKRRQEEDAREEAARRERIQKKLDSLGPAPEKKSSKKDASPKEDAPKATHTIQQRSEPNAGSALEHTGQARQDTTTEGNRELEDPKPISPNDALPPVSPARPLPHDGEGKQPSIWTGPGSRPERLPTWGSPAAPPLLRNVWGSPDNDRGLGNGTFNPDLGRITGSAVAPSQAGQAPAPIGPPSSTRTTHHDRTQPQPPIGSRASRYGATGSELASKWVAAVADNDKKISATKLAERNDRERQMAERGMKVEDMQPAIKETWRPVHVPGDGTRRTTGTAEAQSHHPSLWNSASSREELSKRVPSVDETTPPAIPGVIGSGNNIMLPQGSQNASSQTRPSRFFPAKDVRVEAPANVEPSRSNSPSPPPPTMEGHPAYEGDVMHPHVSLPKPQPIVKLPPSLSSPQPTYSRPNGGWNSAPHPRDLNSRHQPSSHHTPMRSADSTQENWQNRINNLLNGGKGSPPKSMGVDPASKNALDHIIPQDPATVSLPSAMSKMGAGNYRSPLSKPMAEECFEEQEMGSLPQIRLPHKAPDALWEPAEAPTKPMPKRFLVHASIMEPFYFAGEVGGSGNLMRILFPGMNEPRTVTVPFSATRGGRPSQSRGGSRSRGSGHGPRNGKRDKDTSSNAVERTPSHGSGNSSGRGGRGAYRSRGSEPWTRHSSNQTTTTA